FYDLLQHIDLTGADCLDIGTMDGIASFVMAEKGAKSVLATDVAERETFRFARKTLGHDVEYRTDVDMYNIMQAAGGRKFDVVLMAGVLYHVFDPLYAISTVRHLTRHDGLAIIETHYLPNESQPVMTFNPAEADPI